MRYVALIDGEKGAYGAIFPDLPGCTSMGDTVDDVLRKSVEAVRMWAEETIADGKDLPEPRKIEDMREDPEVAEALAEGSVLAVVPLGWTPAGR